MRLHCKACLVSSLVVGGLPVADQMHTATASTGASLVTGPAQNAISQILPIAETASHAMPLPLKARAQGMYPHPR